MFVLSEFSIETVSFGEGTEGTSVSGFMVALVEAAPVVAAVVVVLLVVVVFYLLLPLVSPVRTMLFLFSG